METLRETALRFRDAGIENIKKYCKDNNCEDEYELFEKELLRQADEFNVKLPTDFYKDFYNLTVELNK